MRATESDARAIAEISSEVAKEGIAKEFKQSEISKLVSSDGYYVAVGKLDGKVVGYSMAMYAWGKLHILDTAVRKKERGKGVGKALVEHMISHATELGLPEAYCEVRVQNLASLNLFTSLGFRFRLYSPLVGRFYGLFLPLKRVQ